MSVLPPPPPPEPPVYPPAPAAPPYAAYPSQLPPAYAAMYATPAPFGGPVPRQRTALIMVAQILMVVKGVLWLIAGIGIGAADIALGVAVGRLSNVARWFAVALNGVAGVVALLAIAGQAGHHTSTVGGVIVLTVWLAVNIVIFYALVIDERSRQAFG